MSAPAARPEIRPARPDDVSEILAMVRELADYEREPDAVEATEEQLRAALFGEHPAVFAHVVEHPDRDARAEGRLAGFALWFRNFSTWLGRHGVYLEDLYVRPEHRGRGYGKALLQTLAQVCVDHGYGRLEWWVLDWNESAIGFYRSLGAEPMEEWTTFRITGAALRELAGGAAGDARDLEAGRSA
ncbi:MAG: GNAT family N-acetyltransferase [Motilibacteraceae bacterium]